MIKRLLQLLALGLMVAGPAFGTTTQIIGTLVDASGTPVNGTACFRLPVNAVDTSTSRALSPRPICFPVTNGTFPAFATVVPNDVIQPFGTYYQTRVNDQSGAQIFAANYVIPTGAGTFNIGLAIPTSVLTTNISYLNPATLSGNNVWTGSNTFPFIVSASSNPAQSGFIRMASGDVISWRNNANTGNVALGKNTSDNLTWPNSMVLGSLTPGNCVQAGAVGLLTTTTTPCAVGTVTSVSAGNLSPLFTSSVATSTTTPAITYALVNQNANLVYAGPPSGGAAAPGFRALVASDISAVTVTGQVFSATTLGSDVAVSATTQTDVMTRAITMPSSGCPCRVLMSYSLYITTASSGVGYSAWVNDGSANMAGTNIGQTNGSSGALASLSYSGFTTVTYTNSTVVTFTLRTEGDHTYTVRKASQLAGSAPDSSFQVMAITSN